MLWNETVNFKFNEHKMYNKIIITVEKQVVKILNFIIQNCIYLNTAEFAYQSDVNVLNKENSLNQNEKSSN